MIRTRDHEARSIELFRAALIDLAENQSERPMAKKFADSVLTDAIEVATGKKTANEIGQDYFNIVYILLTKYKDKVLEINYNTHYDYENIAKSLKNDRH
jgi:hypothetical protein